MSSQIAHYCDVMAAIIRKRIPEYYDPDRAMLMAYIACIETEDALREILNPKEGEHGFVKTER